jgi:EAL domain-containing protein (putative c-di-GMP-specific phosphodiesterase class I)
VRSIVDMAHTLGFTVIAEGVESDPQAEFLRDLGCEQAQGFFFARPMPAAAFTEHLAGMALASPPRRRPRKR